VQWDDFELEDVKSTGEHRFNDPLKLRCGKADVDRRPLRGREDSFDGLAMRQPPGGHERSLGLSERIPYNAHPSDV